MQALSLTLASGYLTLQFAGLCTASYNAAKDTPTLPVAFRRAQKFAIKRRNRENGFPRAVGQAWLQMLPCGVCMEHLNTTQLSILKRNLAKNGS